MRKDLSPPAYRTSSSTQDFPIESVQESSFTRVRHMPRPLHLLNKMMNRTIYLMLPMFHAYDSRHFLCLNSKYSLQQFVLKLSSVHVLLQNRPSFRLIKTHIYIFILTLQL